MFNERTSHIQQRIVAEAWRLCNAQFKGPPREETMTGAITVFGAAVGIASLICYLLMTRLQNRRLISGSSRDRSGSVGGSDAGDSGSHFVWSADENSASDHSAAANDSGGGDSGGSDSGGSDGGGGGEGGGGGDGGGGSD
jgi:hypothetical protein